MINLAGIRTLLWLLRERLKVTPSLVGPLSEMDKQYLRADNPALLSLKDRYSKLKVPVHSCWSTWEQCIDLRRFRGKSGYLSQGYLLGQTRRYIESIQFATSVAHNGWMEALHEDGLFGAYTVDWHGRLFSRDLFDSIIEMAWLAETIGVSTDSTVQVLDIGAGYGRFAHRFLTAFPLSQITCVDAVATSTFLCDFYLRYRGCKQFNVVPLDRLNTLHQFRYDLAVCIHAWSEVTLEWIRMWLDFLVDLRIQYLFLVPNFPDFRTKESNGRSLNFEFELARHGYRCIGHRNKFGPHIGNHFGVAPAQYFLFTLSS